MGGFISAEAECSELIEHCDDKIRDLQFAHKRNKLRITKQVEAVGGGSEQEICVRMLGINVLERENLRITQEINALVQMQARVERIQNTSMRSRTTQSMIRMASEVREGIQRGEHTLLHTVLDQLEDYDLDSDVGAVVDAEEVDGLVDQDLVRRFRTLQATVNETKGVSPQKVRASQIQ